MIPDDQLLVSFDVKSLFTSVPTDIAHQQVREVLMNNQDLLHQHTSLSIEEILELLTLCLNAAVFQWQDQIYQQVHGTPMGSPISVVLAELFMQKLEEDIFLNAPYQPIFWKRYLDDIITVLPRDLIHVFLDYINSVNEHITFTVETETNNFLPYLDLNLIRKEDGHLMFDVYRKPSNHNNYLKYDSYHPTQTKRAVVKSLTDRAKNLCSIEVVESEKSKVQAILKSNGYNQNFINRSSLNRPPSIENNEVRLRYVSVPYIKGTYERVQRALSKHNIRLASKPSNTLQRKLNNAKQRTPAPETTTAVYKINCNECDAHYIGETKKQVRDRIKEHQNNIRIGEQNSMIFQHVANNNHNMDFSNPTVLAKNQHPRGRRILETFYSQNSTHAINRFMEVPDVYFPVVRKHLNLVEH